ncbi:putative Ulp1 peptidase [Helianthus annuus]|nr:putative Ulp1 peptidase [Helianthus annuus]
MELKRNLNVLFIVNQVPQQKNSYDCGLFVLYYIERFIKEAPERLTKKDISMFGKQWFLPEEASSLRVRINNLLVQEFKVAKEKETILSPKS